MKQLTACLLCGIWFLVACHSDHGLFLLESSGQVMNDQDLRGKANAYLGSVQPVAPLTSADQAKVILGERLFSEAGLSADGRISCQSCHKLDAFGVDGLSHSKGVFDRPGNRNTPPVAHQSYLVGHSWDGRHSNLAEQVSTSLQHPDEMGGASASQIATNLSHNQRFASLFQAAFPGDEGMYTQEQIVSSLVAFLQTLAIPTRLDTFLQGDPKALSPLEKSGLDLFLSRGCVPCHSGPALGGQQLQRFGIFRDYASFTQSSTIDRGRWETTGQTDDDRVFRVPPLRLVSETAPYFHDGSVASLEDAVRIMGKIQLNQDFTESEIQAIAAFLRTLAPDAPRS
ncbi:MAG: cytochrome c peroxidase [Saprospiraceae bacterium]